MSTLATGSIIARYEVLGKLATGGMSDVYLVRHALPSGFNKVQVLKVILPQLSTNDEFLRMFHNEAKLAAVLNHPNVVQVFDFGKHDDVHYMAMEYINGPSLSRIQKTLDGRAELMPVPVALRIVSDACGALEYAHGLTDTSGQPLQIIHRDISLDNILLAYTGQVKLVDFGIAKARILESHTTEGMLRGKLRYMAPEMISGQPPDRRIDVWAMGVVLYRLLLGRMPFDGKHHAELLNRIVNVAMPTPRSVDPDLPQTLEQILLRALEKDPDRRYDRAGEMQADLEQYQAENQQVALPFHLARFLSELFPTGSDANRESYQRLVGALTPPSSPRAKPDDPEAGIPTRIVEEPPDEMDSAPTRVARTPVESLATVTDVAAAAEEDAFPPGPTLVAREAGSLPLARAGWTDAVHDGAETEEMLAPVSADALTLVGETSTSPSTTGHLPPAGRRGRVLVVALATAVVVGLVGAGVIVFYPDGPDAGAATAPDATAPDATARPDLPAPPPDQAASRADAKRSPDRGADLRTAAPDQRLKPATPPSGPPRVATPRHGRLRVLARPWARVIVDGRAVGSTPMPPLRLREGPHRVVLDNDQLGTHKVMTVQVRPGRDTVIKVRMDQP